MGRKCTDLALGICVDAHPKIGQDRISVLDIPQVNIRGLDIRILTYHQGPRGLFAVAC